MTTPGPFSSKYFSFHLSEKLTVSAGVYNLFDEFIMNI
jgi:outer membrane receptor for ferrienterochelin and colicin